SKVALSPLNVNAGPPSPIGFYDRTKTRLTSQNDWVSLVFRGGSIGQLSLPPPVTTVADETLTPDQHARMPASAYELRVAADVDHGVQPGDRVSRTFTIVNVGTAADVYAVEATSSRGWADLGGAPASVSLAPGASSLVTVTVAVPSSAGPGESDEVVLSAVSQAEPSMSDEARATVVVNRPPSADGQTVAVEQNASFGITLTGQDPDFDALSYAVRTP